MTRPHYDYNDYEFDKEIDINVDVTINFDTNIDFDKTFDADIYVSSHVCIEGNLATLTLDAEAVGYDTLVEVDAAVLTVENELSSITLSVISAA